jgi:hypothetical protein
LRKEKIGFKKELKILKKIKSLNLENNGWFPVIISAKITNVLGEILMTYMGEDMFQIYDVQRTLEG